MATAPPGTKAPAGKAPAAGRSLTTRAVIWLGLAAGTFVTVVSVMNGVRFPGLEVVLSVVVTWALLVVLAATAAELVRRHHRAMARHAWRHGKRGLAAAGRGTRRGGGWLARKARAVTGRLAGKAGPRWENRQAARTGGQPAPQAPPPATTPPAAPDGADGQPTRRVDGRPETDADRRFFDLRESGYTGPVDQDGNAADPSSPGGNRMTEAHPGPAPAPRTRGGRPITGTGSYTGAWKQVVADTADFEPEDDGHLLAWMATEVNGMSAYAEAMTEVYETCVNSVGLDPVAMAATHDVADAAADAASAMAAARAKFAGHYAEVRGFAASGGLLPYDGRWITGDGDA